MNVYNRHGLIRKLDCTVQKKFCFSEVQLLLQGVYESNSIDIDFYPVIVLVNRFQNCHDMPLKVEEIYYRLTLQTGRTS